LKYSALWNNTKLHIFLIFILALVLRLVYLKLAIANLGFERFALYAPDSRLYLLIADHILSGNEMGSYGLLRVGPGYGLIIAIIKLICGESLLWPILLNVVLGALAPVMIYLLATQLFESRLIAVIASLFSAVSLTSVAASTHILTDQPFFTFHAAALVCFVRGYKTGLLKWFIIAGFLAGLAAYTRPIGMIWPYIFILLALVIPVTNLYKNRIALIKKAAVTGLVLLVMIWGWSLRNYIIHDKFIYCTNGMLTVRSCLIAHAAQESWGEGKTIIEYRDQWEAEDGDRTENFVEAYDKAQARVTHEIKNNFDVVLSCYMHNLIENMSAPNYYVLRQIPQVSGPISKLNIAVVSWLGYLIIVLTVIGLVLLFRKGLKFQFWVLGATYFAFSILLGASFWQGSRLHYPAEMAWSIVLAYLIVWTIKSIVTVLRPKNTLVQ
jgi:4-amino-4-deoxy-L-arabinose transferase-like glycosyltransferase